MTPIHPLQSQDIAVVAALEQQAGDVHWSRTQFEQELRSEVARFYVLKDTERIIGYGGYWNVEGEAQITNLVIDPECRREGHGLRLLKYLLEKAASENCSFCTLEVRAGNLAAQTLYKKVGFAVRGVRPGVYEQPSEGAVLMEKTL